MKDAWIDHLSDYLDGELDQKTRDGVTQHLKSCAACRGALLDLRRIRDWASSFQPDAGDEKGWRELEGRIGRRPRLVLGLRAAAVLLMAIGLAAAGWYGSREEGGMDDAATRLAATPLGSLENTDYAAEVKALEAILQERGQDLDPRAREALQASLQSIDEALEKLRRELDRNPEDGLLRELELRSRQQKLRLLNRTVLLSRPTGRPQA